MQLNKHFHIFLVSTIIFSCNTPNKKLINNSLTEKDTIFILFEKGLNKMQKQKELQYKDQNPKYYRILYDIPIYWKQKISKEQAIKEYGKEYISKNGVLEKDFFLFDDYYNHRFWFGTYLTLEEYSEFDDSLIFGNSSIIKKHKSFLKTHKNKIIDYNWLKKLNPPKVWDIFNFQQKNKPTLFIIDKDEFTKDSIVLRNVIYHGQVIE